MLKASEARQMVENGAAGRIQKWLEDAERKIRAAVENGDYCVGIPCTIPEVKNVVKKLEEMGYSVVEDGAYMYGGRHLSIGW